MARDLYSEIYYLFNVEADRRGWVHVDCPFCGDAADPRKPNFSFSRKGYSCFSCDAKGGLKALAQKLGLWEDTPGHRRPEFVAPPRKAPEPEPEEPAAWKENAEAIVESYLHHRDRYKLWQEYKHVSRETIDKHDFGVGPLPEQKTVRLTVPLYWKGQIVGIKGRLLAGTQSDLPPWIAASQSNVTTLWGFNYIPNNVDFLVICENYVDAALVTQDTGEACVATGGARELTDEEMRALCRIRPKYILHAYDNDLAGQATGTFREELARIWLEEKQAEQPGRSFTVPHSRAFLNMTKLRQAGLNAHLFQWPDDAPAKADLLWALGQTA